MMYFHQSILRLYHTKIFSKRLAVSHTINISKYNTLADSRYIKLPKEQDHPSKGLTNIQNVNDNKCFKWCLVIYLHPSDHNTRRTN